MDNIGRLLRELKQAKLNWEQEKGRIAFTGFCEEVGEVFEMRGCGVTLTFLLVKEKKYDTRRQAEFIRKVVLEKFKSYPEIEKDRAIGRYIIKALDNL